MQLKQILQKVWNVIYSNGIKTVKNSYQLHTYAGDAGDSSQTMKYIYKKKQLPVHQLL